MPIAGSIFGMVGALSAFPRRLAAREVERRRALLRRGLTRRTTHVVFGRTLLDRSTQGQVEARYDAAVAAGQATLSELGFTRLLGLATAPQASAIAAQSLLDQSGLTRRELSLLSLFDAFEHDAEPYSFRDLILAKKYAGLIAGGANWFAIARSVRRSGEVASLTALSLHVEDGDAIYARRGGALSELNGQALLPLEPTDDAELEDLFAAAEASEAAGAFDVAAALYRQCLAADASDFVAAFNLANSLKAAGAPDEAAHAFAQAIKLDPLFVEAWFNFAGLLRETGKPDAARLHLKRAIEIDPEYADAIYNLAALEYDAGNLAEARASWVRYLELDQKSDWAKTASRGIQYVDLHLGTKECRLMGVDFLFDGSEDAEITILLAHGAGAPMDSASMNAAAKALAEAEFRVARFEFGYMAARRTSGERRPPPRADTLIPEYVAAVDDLGPTNGPLIIGGKSMGGRVASMAADALFEAKRIAGLLCLGYPFHPPGRPEQLRTKHLAGLRTPTLICQGTRDEFGTREEVPNCTLSEYIEVLWLEDGDHDLKPRKAISGFTTAAHLRTVADAVSAWSKRIVA